MIEEYYKNVKLIFTQTRQKEIIKSVLSDKSTSNKPRRTEVLFLLITSGSMVLVCGLLQIILNNPKIRAILLFAILIIVFFLMLISIRKVNLLAKDIMAIKFHIDVWQERDSDLSYTLFCNTLNEDIGINIKKINLLIRWIDNKNEKNKLPDFSRYVFIIEVVLIVLVFPSIQEVVMASPVLIIPVILLVFVGLLLFDVFHFFLKRKVYIDEELRRKLIRIAISQEFCSQDNRK